MILTFGIICWFISCIGLAFSIAAWVMGRHDLREMRAGRMDPSGQGLTQAGMILGIVHCCIFLVAFVCFLIFLTLGAFFG